MLAERQRLLVIRYLALAPMVQVEVTAVGSTRLQATQPRVVTTAWLLEMHMVRQISGRLYTWVAVVPVVGVMLVAPVVAPLQSMQVLSRTLGRSQRLVQPRGSVGKVVRAAAGPFTLISTGLLRTLVRSQPAAVKVVLVGLAV